MWSHAMPLSGSSFKDHVRISVNFQTSGTCRQAIDGSGAYSYVTEMPGDETKVGWGADNKAHIHFDIICSGCSGSADKRFINKFYLGGVCTLPGCKKPGMVPGPTNQAKKGSNGKYTYDVVIA
jgi:hypothetical protein